MTKVRCRRLLYVKCEVVCKYFADDTRPVTRPMRPPSRVSQDGTLPGRPVWRSGLPNTVVWTRTSGVECIGSGDCRVPREGLHRRKTSLGTQGGLWYGKGPRGPLGPTCPRGVRKRHRDPLGLTLVQGKRHETPPWVPEGPGDGLHGEDVPSLHGSVRHPGGLLWTGDDGAQRRERPEVEFRKYVVSGDVGTVTG